MYRNTLGEGIGVERGAALSNAERKELGGAFRSSVKVETATVPQFVQESWQPRVWSESQTCTCFARGENWSAFWL